MKIMRRLLELVVSFALYSALIALSIYLQEPVSMSGSAAVAVLGGACVFGFLSLVVSRVSPFFCFLGAFLAGLWFPLIFTLIEVSYWREVSFGQLTLTFFSCLRNAEVATPMGSFVGAAGAGVLLGLIARQMIWKTTFG